MDQVDEGVEVTRALGERGTGYDSNAAAFAAILALYARPGQRIADPTWGRGVFWRDVPEDAYSLVATDLATHGIDLRELPYKAASFDLVVLDPPYRPKCSHGGMDRSYGTERAAPLLRNMQDVLALYDAGMIEARRVLKRGGFLIVKCQDGAEGGKQFWTHVEIMRLAEHADFAVRDLVVVTPKKPPPRTCHTRQWHLRKSHSYFLVLRKGGAFPLGSPFGKRATGSRTRGGR